MPDEPAQALGEVLEVVAALRQQDGGAARVKGAQDVVQDQTVAGLVFRECAIDLLDARVALRRVQPEGGLADDEPMVERASGSLAPLSHGEANRSELHLENGIMAVATVRCGGEAADVAGLDLGEYALEGHGRHVTALVHDTCP